VMETVQGMFKKTNEGFGKALTAAIAKCTTDAEDYTNTTVCELMTAHQTFEENTTKKIDALSTKFVALFGQMTDKYVEFTAACGIEASHNKLQMHDRLHAVEMRPQSRDEGHRAGRPHGTEFTSRPAYTAPRRQDTDGEQAMGGHAEARVEAEMFLMHDARDFELSKEANEIMRTNQMRLLQERAISGENFATSRSFGRQPWLTEQAVEQHGSQYPGVAGGSARSERSSYARE